MNTLFKPILISLSFITILLLFSCSVDYSLLNNRQCDNEGKCLPGYFCDRTTMTCIKEGSQLKDTGILPDIISDYGNTINDVILLDTESDVSCIPSNNGTEICDGLDNNCDGQTDEDRVCGNCHITDTIKEICDENTNCDKCFFIAGEKYICISDNGSEFGWKKESDIICNSNREGYVKRCENRCSVCTNGKYSDWFTIQNEECNNKDDNCNAIIDEGDICSTYEVCANGKCIEKPCQKNEDCPQGKICKENKCTSCIDKTDDTICGAGKICVNSSCIEGDCHEDGDCSSGICVSNKCCTDCCRDKKDCPEELICNIEKKCTNCIDVVEDISCGIGYICEDKKCIKGNCHPSLGSLACLGKKICVNYECCEPGPTCCNGDKDCKTNMTCTQSHTCECKLLFGNCNNKYDDGCEKDLSADINNCGICNQKCTLPNADPKCVSGVCQINNCKSGFMDCNNKPADGCEANIKTDPTHCGDCNTDCSNLPNVNSISCNNGNCIINDCNSGYGDCDANISNGCEADLSNDSNNCGICGKKCDNGEVCSNSNCN